MRVGIVRTVGSVCRCAESIAQGLQPLGHDSFIVNSEEIERWASDLAEQCDLVIDHTDTFKGRGRFRPLVRLLLEARGARLVGSDARACLLADDKAATKAYLVRAGIPTPPGIVVTSRSFDLPSWLVPPLVIKPAFEHMSRGLWLARTRDEAMAGAIDLLERSDQPVIVESSIPGRELGISVLEGPRELEALPPVEWPLSGHPSGMLTEAFKSIEPPPDRRDLVRAELPPSLWEEVRAFAQQAFRTLGLRDYARFDVRLTPGGTPFFLEANATPSMEPQEALALSARWAGLDYPAFIDRILSSASRRHGASRRQGPEHVSVDLRTGPVALEVPSGVHVPPPSTLALANLLDVKPGESVLELGCGSGLISIAAAKLGANRVVATDLDPKALSATADNARRNGVARPIETRAGSWYNPLGPEAGPRGDPERFDIIIATPPQTPGGRPFGPRYGGEDGTRHLCGVIQGAPSFLRPPGGRLWLLAISLANPKGLWCRLEEFFSKVELVHQTDRFFSPQEYDAMDDGLFRHLLSLRASGRSDFHEAAQGRYVFQNLFIRATEPRYR